MFSAKLTGAGVNSTNDTGIWVHRDGALSPVARTGAEGTTAGYGPTLGPDVHFRTGFSDLFSPSVNATGDMVFGSYVTGAGVDASNNVGIWESTPEGLSLVARAGTDGPGPNLGPGIHFRHLWTSAMNNHGDVVFGGLLATSMQVDSTNNKGLWASIDGLIIPILRSGDVFDVDPGNGEDLRTISDVDFGGGLPGTTSFTDSGLIALILTFTDGSSGIFTAQLPGVAPIGGDYNGDGMIDAADYTVWRDTQGASGVGLVADANGDLVIDAFDYLTWRNNFGQPAVSETSVSDGAAVPEPTAVLLALLAGVAMWAAPRLHDPGESPVASRPPAAPC
nr:choice-of-anchor tandem repeat NxxGxxAF-containing protein [Pirellulimonas nuda]